MCSFYRFKSAILASIAGNIYQIISVESQHRYNDFTTVRYLSANCRGPVGRLSVMCRPGYSGSCSSPFFFHELVLIQDNTSGPGLCYRCRLYKSFYDLKRQHLTA